MHATLSSPGRAGGIVKRAQSPPSSPPHHSRRKLDLLEPESVVPSNKERILSSATRIYILPEKLTEEEMDDLRVRISDLGGLNSSLTFANVILTNLRAKKRILRQLDEVILGRKVAVLHLSWLHACAGERLMQPFEKFQVLALDTEEANLASLRSGMPIPKSGAADVHIPIEGSSKDDEDKDTCDGRLLSREASIASEADADKGEGPSADTSSPSNVPAWYNTEYACLRPSPFKSHYNQALIDELEVLRLQRLQSGKQEMNATAYGRAISAVKALPFALAPAPSRARHIKGVGVKIAKLIEQFYNEGHIAEAKSIQKDVAFRTMTQLMELYGVGPKRAREFYSQGARTVEEVIRMGGSLSTHLHVQDCLQILPDLRCKIPRDEVVEIANVIMKELETIRPGCVHTICGGFRRGKQESNDVDIVITDPNPPSLKSQITCMEELLRQLKKKAIITHVVNITTPSSTFETVYSHLDIAEVVILSPKSTIVQVARHRRVDIIFCPYRTYGAAVLGWTGSRQFERDLRLLAKHKGFKFHSTGIVNQQQSHPYATPREEDIFNLLQIPYMPPQWRNCDA